MEIITDELAGLKKQFGILSDNKVEIRKQLAELSSKNPELLSDPGFQRLAELTTTDFESGTRSLKTTKQFS